MCPAAGRRGGNEFDCANSSVAQAKLMMMTLALPGQSLSTLAARCSASLVINNLFSVKESRCSLRERNETVSFAERTTTMNNDA